MQKKTGKKAIAIIALIIAISATVGITAANSWRRFEQRANNFKMGKISMELTEEKWEALTDKDKLLYPSKVVSKDPKVKNTGENDLYAYIEVRVPRAQVRTVNADETLNAKALTELFTYTVNSGWELISDSITEDGEYAVKIYAYTEKAVEPGKETSCLFNSVTYANVLEGDLTQGTQLQIKVYAHAIQSDYLGEEGTTVKEKMNNAYKIYLNETAEQG